MATIGIDKIQLLYSNKKIDLDYEMFTNFYLTNMNDNGEEVNFIVNKESLSANFFIIKILYNKLKDTDFFRYIKENQNLTKIKLFFKNGTTQEFVLAKRRIAYNGKMINKYEQIIEVDEDLGIIISEHPIKYKKELFA